MTPLRYLLPGLLVVLAVACAPGASIPDRTPVAEGVGFVVRWGSEGSGDGQFAMAAGVAVDRSGNVYVADSSSTRVQVFSDDGELLRQWGSTPSIPGDRDGECLPDGGR